MVCSGRFLFRSGFVDCARSGGVAVRLVGAGTVLLFANLVEEELTLLLKAES